MEVKDRHRLAVAAAGLRWRQPDPRMAGAGAASTKSRPSGLPDGLGAVSEAGRYTRGTGCVTPLEVKPAQTRQTRLGWRRAPALHDRRAIPVRALRHLFTSGSSA